MTRRPALLLYCQHHLGLGHLVRTLALAEALVERFEVVMLSGGALPAGVRAPRGVRMVPLPALGLTVDGALVSRDDRHYVEDAFALRRRTILATWRSLRPAAVVLELFPFGRKKFGAELLPLLEAVQAAGPARPLVVCSLRDILVERGDRALVHDERACRIANRHFDAVLVHADPRIARLEETFRPATPLRVPVRYTGYVVPDDEPPAREHRAGIVVSAGSGVHGGPLVAAAVEAHRTLWPRRREPMRIVAGPSAPDATWDALRRAADETEGLEAVRWVQSLRDELARARASVSLCGYNTALDVLRSRVPALVVPAALAGEGEQSLRARRLERLGALRVLDEQRLDGPALASALDDVLRFEPRPVDLRLDGAAETVRALERLLAERRQEAVA